jgi:hypothetical protein
MSRLNPITDMSGIKFNVGTGAHTQIDATNHFSRINMKHLEKIGRNPMRRMQRDLDWFQDKLVVSKSNIAELLA